MLPAEVQTFLTKRFQGITTDSREVVPGGLFVAYPGEVQDGRDYIEQAIATGAKGVLYEAESAEDYVQGWPLQAEVDHLAVNGLKQHAGEIAAVYYGEPTQQCQVIGVTGTNGKTTVTQWLAQAFSQAGQKSAVLGTLGYGRVNKLKPTCNTTPDAVLLQAMMAELVEEKNALVAMEVSSHGLVQDRVRGVHFDVAVFTNLSRDHLDYHKTMAAYGAAKRRLFEWDGLKQAVINTDDAFGRTVAQSLIDSGQSVVTYGLNPGLNDSHVQGETVSLSQSGLRMQIVTASERFEVEANVVGEFNALNILAVVATMLTQEISPTEIQAAVAKLTPVAGRMQQLGGNGQPLVVVDYAHTPAALETVLKSLRLHCNQAAQLWCVFGCGGNRDKGKRALMAKAASAYADKVVVTSDNPRDEAPMAIIQEIEDGLDGAYWVEVDRAAAIKTALQSAKPADVVLIAGKGHEDYQEIAGVKHKYSDVKVAKQVLKAMAVQT